MKSKICVVCLLLIFVYCLSAVCAADLNQTTDDVKTDDDKDIEVVLDDDIVEVDRPDYIAESADNQVSDEGNSSLDGKAYATVEEDNQTSICDTVSNETVIDPANPIHWVFPKIPGCQTNVTPWHPGMPIPGMPVPIKPILPIIPKNITPLCSVIAVNPVVKEMPGNQTPLPPFGPGTPIFPMPCPGPIIPIPVEPSTEVYTANFGAASDSVPNGWLAL